MYRQDGEKHLNHYEEKFCLIMPGLIPLNSKFYLLLPHRVQFIACDFLDAGNHLKYLSGTD